MTQQRQSAETVNRKQSVVRRWSRKLTLTALSLAMATLGLLGSTPQQAEAATQVGSLSYISGYRTERVCSFAFCQKYEYPIYSQFPLNSGEIIDFRGTSVNDTAYGITVNAGAKIAVYRDSDLLGVCEVFTASDGDLGNNLIGRETISSVHVGADCNAPVARIYEHSNYSGMSRVLGTTAQYNAASGWYEITNLDAGNVDFNDAVSSIRLFPGQVLQVCQHADFGGNCAVLASSVANMGTIGLVGNDSISSLRFSKP